MTCSLAYRAAIIAAVSAMTAACNGRSVTTSTAPSSVTSLLPAAQVDSMIVGGASNGLSRGARAQLHAFARRTDGSAEDVTAQAEWTSDNTSVAMAESDGWVTGVGAGKARIAARYEGSESIFDVTVSGDPNASSTSDSGSSSGSSGSGSSSGSNSGSTAGSGGGASTSQGGSNVTTQDGSTSSPNPSPAPDSSPCLPSPLPTRLPTPLPPCPLSQQL